jgi:hypothetical protein
MASYIANDNTKEYPGEDYEDIYLNVFNALNFYNDGNIEGALVEIRKLTTSSGKLDMLSRKYEDATKSAGDHLMDGLKKIGITMNSQLPQGDPVNFSSSALAHYLGVLFYLGENNEDSARIEFEALKATFATNPKVYHNPIPKSIEDMQTVPAGKARLNIIGFAGLSPVKEEKVFEQSAPFLNAPYNTMQFKLPVLKERPSNVNRIEVEVQGYGKFELELLEDMTAVTEETYNARFANMFFKTYIRTVLKNAAASIASDQVGKKNALAGLGTKVAGKVVVNASEAADIRMGRFFPDKAYVGAIDLEPGTYTITVNFGGYVKEFKDVDVKAGNLNLLEAVDLQ